MNISSREKILIAVAFAAIGLLLVFHFSLRPAILNIRRLRSRVIPDKLETLSKTRALAEEYRFLKREIDQLSREMPEPEAGFIPLSFLENALEQSRIAEWSLDRTREERGESVVQESIEVRITQTGWEELVSLLQRLDAAEPSLRLNRIDIRRQRGRREGLGAVLTVTGLRMPD